LAGLWRLFMQTTVDAGGQPRYAPGPDPRASHAAADGVLKSIVGPIERIALLFGWAARPWADDYDATINRINEELARLRPT